MTLIFQKASILSYRMFDVAEEIHLEHARKLLTEDARRLKLGRENSQYLQLPNPPLGVDLGKKPLGLKNGTHSVDVLARTFDHGAMSVAIRLTVTPGTSMTELIALADELYDAASVDQLALEICENLRRTMAPATEGPHLWEQTESYTIVFTEKVQDEHGVERGVKELLADGPSLVRLLLGEPQGVAMSEREMNEVLQARFSYREDDLVIVDWNSAFVFEPSGSMDIPDVLEIANAQLLELRYYEHVLDTQLQTIYGEMQKKKPGFTSLFRSPYRKLARRVFVTMLEMNEFVERVENSLKVIGDFYLAKVYEASVKRLRIPSWQASVTRKQQMLTNVYNLLKGEVDTDRALTLEAAIVVLIVTEMLIAFWGATH